MHLLIVSWIYGQYILVILCTFVFISSQKNLNSFSFYLFYVQLVIFVLQI